MFVNKVVFVIAISIQLKSITYKFIKIIRKEGISAAMKKIKDI